MEIVKKRSAAIDMVKGLSILTLFFLHFENGYFNFDYNYFIIRSPAFYIVVGWLWGLSTKKRTISEHWAKRKNGLVKPYIYLSILFILVDILIVAWGYREPFIIFRDIYKTICLRGIGTLWFLPALLGGELIFLYIRNKNNVAKISVYFLCIAIIYLYSYWDNNGPHMDSLHDIINAPFRVFKDMSDAFIYISLAYYISHKYGKIALSQGNIKLFIEGVLSLILSFLLLNYSTSNNFCELLLFIIGNVFAGLGILILFTSIESISILSKPLEYFGKNSLIVMSFHFCLLFQITLIVDKYILYHDAYSGGITIIYFAIALLAQIILIELINCKFKFIIGK